jgi:hypothetical protein
MKPCDDLSVDLLRYLENDLSEQEVKYFRAHLNTCAFCQGRLEQERALSRSLQESRPLRRGDSCARWIWATAGIPCSHCGLGQ